MTPKKVIVKSSVILKRYVRFKKEIKRAKEQNLILYIIIEEPFSTVLQGYQYSTVKGISIIRKLWTLYFYYGVYHVFCDSRKEMSTYITEMFIYCNNKQMWVNNE